MLPQVLTLPPGAIRLATSPTAVNELWCYGPNVLASQFHLEFDEPLVLDKIWKTLKDVGRLDEQQAEESRRVLEAGGQQNASMLQVRLGDQQSTSGSCKYRLQCAAVQVTWDVSSVSELLQAL